MQLHSYRLTSRQDARSPGRGLCSLVTSCSRGACVAFDMQATAGRQAGCFGSALLLLRCAHLEHAATYGLRVQCCAVQRSCVAAAAAAVQGCTAALQEAAYPVCVVGEGCSRQRACSQPSVDCPSALLPHTRLMVCMTAAVRFDPFHSWLAHQGFSAELQSTCLVGALSLCRKLTALCKAEGCLACCCGQCSMAGRRVVCLYNKQ